MRARIRPVTPASTGVFTHSLVVGVTAVRLDAFAGTAVAPALSPCQPLLRPTSCELRRSLVMVILPPRFGTSCHIKPLANAMSTGFTMKKVATYSTLPWSFRAARARSVMSRLCASCGSSSPNARPVMVSYWMSWPESRLCETGQSAGESMTILVTFACACGAHATSAATAAPTDAVLRSIPGIDANIEEVLSLSEPHGWAPQSPRATVRADPDFMCPASGMLMRLAKAQRQAAASQVALRLQSQSNGSCNPLPQSRI